MSARIRPSWPLIKLQLPLRVPRPFETCQTRGIRSIRSVINRGPKASRFNQASPPKALSPKDALARREHTTPFRTGVLARKKGMSVVWDEESGSRIPCTVLQLDRNQVVSHKTRERHGYNAVQIGFGFRHPENLTRPELGHFAAAKVSPKEELVEFKVKDSDGLLPVGTTLGPTWFKVGQLVDTKSKTKGKGFSGGMKRHGWSGQPASHGQSLTHRTMGSAGGGQGSGSRVHPGKNMPGRMGNEFHTCQNLQVLKVDEENGLLLVKGCVSGPTNSIIRIQDSKKKPGQVDVLALPRTATDIAVAAYATELS